MRKARVRSAGSPEAQAAPLAPLPVAPEPPSEPLDEEMRRLRAVRDVARALGGTLDRDRLLDLILHHVTDAMQADRSTLYLTTDDGQGLWSKITQGDQVLTIRLKVGEGIAGHVAREGKTLRIDDAYADPRFNREVDRNSGYVTRSILCAPLRSSTGRILGVVQVLNRRGGPFTRDDQELLEVLASQAALSIENAALYAEAVQRADELRAAHAALAARAAELDLLYQVEREMSGAHGLDELLDRILGQATERIGAEAGTILLADRPGGELLWRAARGAAADTLRRRPSLLPGQGIEGQVAATGQALLVNDPAREPAFEQGLVDEVGFRPTNLLCVALASDDGPLGAFTLLSKRGPGGFSDADRRLLTLIAGQAASAIRLARAKEEHRKEERLAAIGQLLSGLLHDFKTPMTVLSGYAQMLASVDDRAQRETYSAELLRQLDAMNAMTREVLAFARGDSTLLLRKVPLDPFLKDLARQLGPEMAAGGVRLVVDASEGGSGVFDESKWLRVIHNLARNAVEAMPSGGTFTIAVRSDGDDLVWTFADTGRGIPPEIQARLYEVFASSGKAGGTGLGLAIVKKIVDDHGGRVACRTSAGVGTTFTIHIPRQPRR